MITVLLPVILTAFAVVRLAVFATLGNAVPSMPPTPAVAVAPSETVLTIPV